MSYALLIAVGTVRLHSRALPCSTHCCRLIVLQALAAHLINLWDKTLLFRSSAAQSGCSTPRQLLLLLGIRASARLSLPVLKENLSKVLRGAGGTGAGLGTTIHLSSAEEVADDDSDAVSHVFVILQSWKLSEAAWVANSKLGISLRVGIFKGPSAHSVGVACSHGRVLPWGVGALLFEQAAVSCVRGQALLACRPSRCLGSLPGTLSQLCCFACAGRQHGTRVPHPY